MSALEDLVATVAELRRRWVEPMVPAWATVTAVSPLRIQLDIDTAPLGSTPVDLVGNLVVGSRVWVTQRKSQTVIVGKPNGDGVPVGAILEWPLAALPDSSWLWAEGVVYDPVAYPALFALYGANGGTAANPLTPNRKGRVSVGQDTAQAEFDSLHETGGEKAHALTAAENGPHTHTQDAHSHNVSLASIWYNDGGSNNIASGSSTRRTTTSNPGTTSAQPTIQQSGSGTPHNNLQPYVVTRYMVKAR